MAGASFYVGGMLRLRAKLLLATVGLVAGLVVSSAAAGERPVVVELYTSQGCNSCPPADEALARLAARPDVIPLSLHVDYWDYLGWRDTFGQRQHGQRQQDYRDALGERAVFTPQLIVQGEKSVRVSGLDAAIRGARAPVPTVEISVAQKDGMLMCTITPLAGPVSGTIFIAKYSLSETVDITRGENAGRVMTYRNVVTNLSRFGDWSGDAAEDYPMPQPDPGEGVAVWIQDGDAGRVLAAAKVENPAP